MGQSRCRSRSSRRARSPGRPGPCPGPTTPVPHRGATLLKAPGQPSPVRAPAQQDRTRMPYRAFPSNSYLLSGYALSLLTGKVHLILLWI